jgi:hypothetical protein
MRLFAKLARVRLVRVGLLRVGLVRSLAAALAGLVAAGGAGPLTDLSTAAPIAAAPTIGSCPVFPADNIWNTRVDTLPRHPSSDAYINTIGTGRGLKADFGAGLWDGGPIGIPFVTVPGTQPKVPITFDYASESDPGPYPIPPNPPIEGGPNSTGDRHILVIDRDNCLLYETWSTYPQSDGSWHAGSGAKFDLRSNNLRSAGWTSSDAAGLAVYPALLQYDEIQRGQIEHALRFTASLTQRAYVWPARHYASSSTNTSYPPMGIRVRLKSSFDISGYSAANQVILRALKNYGMMLADNGSSWYIQGVPDERWNNDDLQRLGSVLGSNLEVVDTSSLMVSSNSGQAGTGSATPTSTPTRTPTSQATSTPTAVPTSTPTTGPTKTPTPTTPPTSTPTSTPSTQQTQLVLRDAALGDTWISPDFKTQNFGATDRTHLQGSFTPDRLLYLPNLSGLPAGATIVSATLELNAYQYSGSSQNSVLGAYRVLRAWSPSSATYVSPWSAAGLVAGVDYASTPVGTFTANKAGWLRFDVTSAVQSWQSGSPRYGLMLRQTSGPGNAHFRVYMSEVSNQSLRPRLTITYR